MYCRQRWYWIFRVVAKHRGVYSSFLWPRNNRHSCGHHARDLTHLSPYPYWYSCPSLAAGDHIGKQKIGRPSQKEAREDQQEDGVQAKLSDDGAAAGRKGCEQWSEREKGSRFRFLGTS